MKDPKGNEVASPFEFLALCSFNTKGYVVLGFDYDPSESNRNKKGEKGYVESKGAYNNVFLVWPEHPTTRMQFTMDLRKANKLITLLHKKNPSVHYERFLIKRV